MNIQDLVSDPAELNRKHVVSYQGHLWNKIAAHLISNETGESIGQMYERLLLAESLRVSDRLEILVSAYCGEDTDHG